MRNVKRWLALGLSLMMVLGVTACGKEGSAVNNSETQQSVAASNTEASSEVEEVKEPITLEWWYRGNGIQKDTELVEAEFNKLLQTFPGMENVSVNLNCYTGADYGNAVALAQSADQQIDILNSVYLNFVDQVKMGSYISLNDLLEENEALYNELPEWLWELGAVDGEIYMVPHYQRAANQEYMVIPKEYLEKYGDEDAIRALCADTDRTVEEVAAVLEAFTTAVQAGEGKTKYMMSLGQMYTHAHGFLDRYDNISNDIVLYEDADKVEYLWTSEDALKAYEISAEWYDKGLIHPDRLTVEESELTYKNMMNPVSYCFSIQNGAGSEELVSKQLSDSYGFEVVAIPIWDNYFIANAWGAGGDGITPDCENPVEALRLLELMNTEEGTELYNMVVYGLEDTHWEWVDKANNKIKTLEYDGTQGGVDASYAGIKWIMGNTFRAYLNQGCVEGENEISLDINENPDNATSSIMGFRVDISGVQTQIEQIKAVTTEYKETIRHGVLGSAKWEDTYKEYLGKLETAGLNDVIKEIQTQVDAFKAAK